MKLAYMILGTFNSGGMERILSNKVNYLAQLDYDITIITTDQSGRQSFFEFDKKIHHIDLNINFTQTTGFNLFKKTVLFFAKQREYKHKVKKLLFRERFDVVVSMFGAEVHWLHKLEDGSRKIAEIHFSKFFREQQARRGLWALSDWYRSRMDERAIEKYDRFVVLTHEDKVYWGNYSNIEVIHNACHIVPRVAAKLENKQAIAVGRLTFQKGCNYMIDAWRIVVDKHPDWTLNIYGGGEDRQSLQSQIDRLDLTDKVVLYEPTNQIEQKIVDSSIYLLSSRYEGLPMVLLEAMACGVPCVSFMCKCGPRDVISNGVDGFLVDEGNIDEMANRICTLIENETLRQEMGGKAVEKVARKFSIDIIMKQWIRLFEDVCKINKNE